MGRLSFHLSLSLFKGTLLVVAYVLNRFVYFQLGRVPMLLLVLLCCLKDQLPVDVLRQLERDPGLLGMLEDSVDASHLLLLLAEPFEVGLSEQLVDMGVDERERATMRYLVHLVLWVPGLPSFFP